MQARREFLQSVGEFSLLMNGPQTSSQKSGGSNNSTADVAAQNQNLGGSSNSTAETAQVEDTESSSEQNNGVGRILVGEGTDCDFTTIQAAVDAAPEHNADHSDGATIYIRPSYDGRKYQETVWIRKKQVKIEGHERSSAAVYPKDGHYAFVVEGTSSYDYDSTRSIQNLSVRGGKGALLGAGLVQFKMESCQIVEAEECARLTTGKGLHTDKPKPVNVETIFRDVNCHFMKGDVFNLEGRAANNKTLFDNCTINRTEGRGFNITGAATEINNATAQFCEGGAVSVNPGSTFSVGITGSYFESNGAGMDNPRDIDITAGRGTYVKNNYFNAGSHSRCAINVLGGIGAQIKGNTYNRYEQQDGGNFIDIHDGVEKTDIYATTNNGIAPLLGLINSEVFSFGEKIYDRNGNPVNGGLSSRYGPDGEM